jgi:hypothetical protein
MRELLTVDGLMTAGIATEELIIVAACLTALVALCVRAPTHGSSNKRLSVEQGVQTDSEHYTSGNQANGDMWTSPDGRTSSRSLSKGASSMSQLGTKSDSAAIFTLPSTCTPPALGPLERFLRSPLSLSMYGH